MRAAANAALDSRARAWLLDYAKVAMSRAATPEPAATELADTQAQALAGGPLDQKLKRVRLYYVGDLLRRVEAGGTRSAQARVAVPYVARGRMVPRTRRLAPLTPDERRGALGARDELDARARQRGLRPPSPPSTRSPRERQREAAAERRLWAERRQRREPATFGVPFDAVFEPHRLRLVLNLLGRDGLPDSYARDGDEISVALNRLESLDPEIAGRLRSDPTKASHEDLAWIVAQTDTALNLRPTRTRTKEHR